MSTERLNTGLLLYIATRALESRIIDALVRAGFDDLTAPLTRVLQNLDPQGTRLTVLAERALISKQNAKYIVDQLERGRYVERRADPGDRRAVLVTMTDRGRATGTVAAATTRQVLREWDEHLGGGDLEVLNDILSRLRELTDPYA